MSGVSRFVPEAPAAPQLLIQQVQKLLDECTRFSVLTGAGLSTESGLLFVDCLLLTVRLPQASRTTVLLKSGSLHALPTGRSNTKSS